MSRTRSLLGVLLLAALLTPVKKADAAYSMICSGYSSCKDKGYDHYGYQTAQKKSYWAMYTGTNCTNYVAYRLVTTNGMPNQRPKSGVGNARDWGKAMSSITDSKPAVGSVAWWGRTGNHVAYVEKVVSSDEVWISESNWGSAFSWRKLTKGSGWPDGFIHFKDTQPLPILKATEDPALDETPQVDQEIEVDPGEWSPTSGTTFTYQWVVDGQDVSGADDATFTPTAAMVGKSLVAEVKAARSGYRSKTERTPAVAITPGDLVAETPPQLSGTPREGRTLTATPGTWSPAPSAGLFYRWFADGVQVAGASGSTFTPTADLVGQQISVRATARRTGYTDERVFSASTSAVMPDQLTMQVAPTVSGTLRVGELLTADPGQWLPRTTDFAYRWFADGKVISGRTASTLRLTADELGKQITVEPSARYPDYDTRSATSEPTAAVAKGVIVRDEAPKITGKTKVGSTLKASTGTWKTDDLTFTYRWVVAKKTVPGATSSTYKLPKSAKGHTVRVYAIASRAGFTSRESLVSDHVWAR